MHDRLDHHRMNEDAALAAALRALPGEMPPHDAWPQLVARVRRRRQARHVVRIALPAALAAGIALMIVWPHVRPQVHRNAQPAVQVAQQSSAAPSVSADELATLQARSRQWQAWVARLDREGAPLNGHTLATAVALQDRIGLVDLQLSAARDNATTAQLWQQRITLLQQLGLLHLQPYAVARQTRTASKTIFM